MSACPARWASETGGAKETEGEKKRRQSSWQQRKAARGMTATLVPACGAGARQDMFDKFQPWVLATYGDSAKTKTITRKKARRIAALLVAGDKVGESERADPAVLSPDEDTPFNTHTHTHTQVTYTYVRLYIFFIYTWCIGIHVHKHTYTHRRWVFKDRPGILLPL